MHLPVAVRVLDAAPARRGPTASGLVSEEQMASRMSVAVWPSEHECGRERGQGYSHLIVHPKELRPEAVAATGVSWQHKQAQPETAAHGTAGQEWE